MFRPNNFGARTQTMTQLINQNNGQTEQSSQSNQTSQTNQTNQTSSSSRNSSGHSTTNDNIIFAIVTGNLNEVRILVNSTNVNTIIDLKNKYTALHYAVKLPNNDIVEYLMNCGASPSIKTGDGKDAVDLSIEANKRFLIDRVISDASKETDGFIMKYDNLNYNNKILERENKELKETNQYLEKINSQNIEKIDNLKKENANTKRKLDESETAFTNLLKKSRKDNK